MPDLSCTTVLDRIRIINLCAATLDANGQPLEHPKMSYGYYYTNIDSWLDVRAIFVVNNEADGSSYITKIHETVWEERKPKWSIMCIIIKQPTITIYTTKKKLTAREQLKWATIIRTLGRLPDNAKIILSYRKDLLK